MQVLSQEIIKKELEMFDKKGGFKIKLKQYSNNGKSYYGIKIQQFDFGKGDQNKKISLRLDSVEAADISDKIMNNLRDINNWKQISVYHKFSAVDHSETITTLSIDTYQYSGKFYITVSTKQGDTSLTTSLSIPQAKFLSKVLTQFAIDCLEVIPGQGVMFDGPPNT